MLKKNGFYRRGHHTMTLCAGVLVLCQWLSACSSVQDLPAAVNGRSVYGSWLDLNDARKLTLSPGVFLELPDAPYRARFADKDGIYFQASRPLVFSTQHGFAQEAEGGLYMRNDNTLEATTWLYPTLGAVGIPYATPLKIQYHPAQP
jgi:hypothetical protein